MIETVFVSSSVLTKICSRFMLIYGKCNIQVKANMGYSVYC